MKLIGMLDSPYVRRVAISLKSLGLPFEHHSVSVFSTFEQFKAINPVVKAPTLVCDGGEVLMDSSLILDYLEALAGPERSLMPSALPQRLHELRLIGLALAACEKSVQIVYERNLRRRRNSTAPGWSGSAANCRPPMPSWSASCRNSPCPGMEPWARPASAWRWPGASAR